MYIKIDSSSSPVDWYRECIGLVLKIDENIQSKNSTFYNAGCGYLINKDNAFECDKDGNELSENDRHYTNNPLIERKFTLTYRCGDVHKVEDITGKNMVDALSKSKVHASSAKSCSEVS